MAPRPWDQPDRVGRLVTDQRDSSDRSTGPQRTSNRTQLVDQPDTGAPEPTREPERGNLEEEEEEEEEVSHSSVSLYPANDNGRPRRARPNDRHVGGTGKAEPSVLPASVDVDQPAAQPPLLAQVKPTHRQEAYISDWCQAHGIEGEWYPESKAEAAGVIEEMEEAKRSRKTERMVERLVRQKLQEQAGMSSEDGQVMSEAIRAIAREYGESQQEGDKGSQGVVDPRPPSPEEAGSP
jgi:hypothetical protein